MSLFKSLPLLTSPLSRLTMSRTNTTSKPKVNKLQQLIHSDPSGGWEKCWEKGVTPWDLGQPTPILVHLDQTGCLPKGRVLVPGCGSGHDVVAIACPERFVVGLDVSENAIKQATKPEMRSQWASRIRDLLKPDGELITLIFPISDHEGGPPYKVSVSDYEEVLHPMGIRAESIVENHLAIPPRRGREKLGRWKRSTIYKSLL